MSQENVELVRTTWPNHVDMVELLKDGRPPPKFTTAVAADVEVMFRPNALGRSQPSYRGIDGFADGWRDWLEPYESYWIEVEDWIDAGDEDVLIPVRIRARTHRDGVVVEHSPAAICTVRNREIVRAVFYLDRGEALEAIGKAERDALPEQVRSDRQLSDSGDPGLGPVTES
jgi:ketosteroid isomerase-like protein